LILDALEDRAAFARECNVDDCVLCFGAFHLRVLGRVGGGELRNLSTEVGERFSIADYPSTERALQGGAFTVRADDPGSDTAELAILDDLAAVAVVGAGGRDASGDRWLVEVYTDPLSGPERDLVTLLRPLVAVALSAT
ncbi:MAG: hypothetical protein ABI720_13735, partial [Actinomycetes bacterium]